VTADPRPGRKNKECAYVPVLTYAKALNQALIEEMDRDDSVFVCGEEVAKWGGSFTVSMGLLDRFGEKRVRDTPISEEGIVGLGIGAAMAGLKPVVEIMTINFILLAMDQIVNHMAKFRYMSGGQVTVPLVIRTPGGGRLQMGSQHSQSLESMFVHVPGLVVMAPSTPYDAKGMLKSAIRGNNPVLFIEHESIYNTKSEVPDEEYFIPIGKADVKRKGSDITIIAHLRMLHVALEAAKRLEAEHGISAEVIDPRTLVPLDKPTLLMSVKKTGKAVIVQECWPHCSIGTDIAYTIMSEAFDYLDAPVKVISSAPCPFPYSRQLEQLALPRPETVVDAVKQMMGR